MKRNETSLAVIQHFVSDSSHVHCTVLDTVCTRTHTYVHVLASHQRTCCDAHSMQAMLTIRLNFREENFRDQQPNHKIYENIVP